MQDELIEALPCPERADELRAWPFNGYAPGSYMCSCIKCKTRFEGDKRAITCLACAVIMSKDYARHANTRATPSDTALREALERICAPLGNEPNVGDRGYTDSKARDYWRQIAVGYRTVASAALAASPDAEVG